MTQTLGYDADSRLASDNLANGSTAWPRYGSPTMRAVTYTLRNGRGQVRTSTDGSTFNDAISASYSGLGYLLTSTLTQTGVFPSNSAPATWSAVETSTPDGLGNLLAGTSTTTLNGNVTTTQQRLRLCWDHRPPD